ncbi:MAG: DUF4340 domain-containing protein [Lachnospiraceae bacterium]|nr:DUF4340 domain-containing protein [Lachnospiraceae bacterium]
MKIKNFKLIIGVVIICVLCGVYYGLTVYNEKTEQAEEEAAEGEVILEVDTSTLTAVTYTIDGEQVSFTLQEDGSWQKDDDETFPVDSSALLAPLEEAAELKSIRTLTDIEDTSEYGLDEPQNTITLTNEDGEETVITIGDNNASTGNDYLMLNEETSMVYTVSTDLSSAFSDDIYDYAESEEIPTLQASAITGVRLEETDGEGYDLYIEDAIWMVSSVNGSDGSEADAEEETVTAEELADGVEADADEADTLTSALAGLAYVDFLDHNCTDFSKYGLDEPTAILTITYEEEVEDEEEDSEETETEDAEEEAESESETETEDSVETIERTVTFQIGDTDDNGNYYVRMEDSLEVHTISSTVLSTAFGYTASDLIAPEEEETETEVETETDEETEIETDAGE